MNIKMRYLAAIVAGMLIAVSTVGAKTNVIGAGAMSCGYFVTKSKDSWSVEYFYNSWVQGFLSGLNASYKHSETHTTELSDRDGMKVWILDYCQENSLDNFYNAAISLWKALRDKQGLEPDPRFIRKD